MVDATSLTAAPTAAAPDAIGCDRIDEAAANAYFERLDPLVRPGTVLFVIGGSAIAQLGAKIRVTADIDVALPYSTFEMSEFVAASAKAGLPVDPAFGYQGAYVELVKPLMLTLPKPASVDDCIVLFQGANLTVRTSGPADLVASKLYRYSEQDQEDVQFLMRAGGVTLEAVREAVSRLPARFRDDVIVRENLANLEADLEIWKGSVS